MFRMFAQFFTMLSTLFHAGEQAANALDTLAGWSDEQAKGFVESSRIERATRLEQLRRQQQAQLKEVPKQEPKQDDAA